MSKVVHNVFKWVPCLVKYANWDEIQAEWKFRKCQAQRHRILEDSFLRHAQSMTQLQNILPESHKMAQGEERHHAQHLEAEQAEEFRRIEGWRQREFEEEMDAQKHEDDLERRERISERLTKMRQEQQEFKHSSTTFCSDLVAELNKLVLKRLKLFEAEEEREIATLDALKQTSGLRLAN
ncbi:hypothetical protein C0995_010884 [Termitomyces sp. Mi166|nr:hypothetical protein C0995_010884 [Termitomyces sp. Mi166\